MSTQTGDPYHLDDAEDTGNPATTDLLEETFVAAHTTVNLTPTLQANAETLNGGIPGPIIRVKKGDSFVVRLKNNLDHATGLHWHGIEMANKKDGTPFTQSDVPPGGTYLYKLRAPRAGLFWYHPHSHTSTNQTFRGMYGAIVVTDEDVENDLVGVLPTDTLALVLSDTTVCKAPATNNTQSQNDTETYPAANQWSWAGPGGVFPGQPGPAPIDVCELKPFDDHGDPMNPIVPFDAGDIPNIQPKGPVPFPGGGRVNEGQTVLTNGIQVEHRGGTHDAPDQQFSPAQFHPVTPGQGLRLQIFNCATTRYFRLHLSSPNFSVINLYRIGGEGGLLEKPILETDLKTASIPEAFADGEILLPAGSRADVVAVIPPGLATDEVLTLWTLDYPRLGGQQWCGLPTVPVAHFKNNNAAAQSFAFDETKVLRPNGPAILDLSQLAQTDPLLDPSTFQANFIPPKKGKTTPPLDVIELQAGGGTTKIDGTIGDHDLSGPYSIEPHIDSARYAQSNAVLELFVKNSTLADHPFHLHGASFQPIELVSNDGTGQTYSWNFLEFRDNINVPAGYTLRFRVHIEPRPLVDDVTPGGEMGRWLFHCHIFFHAHLGMMSELVICDANGREKPCIDVFGSWAYANDIDSDASAYAERNGNYAHPDHPGFYDLFDYSDPTTFTVTDSGAPGDIIHTFTVDANGPGTWHWEGKGKTGIYYVYVAVKDTRGYLDQCVFRVKFGGTNDGSDNGDPHIHTIDGKRYDFQAAGEFTLLRDREAGLEIQARQTPVAAANPVTDSYSGLRSCVSVNTAVAMRAGRHVVSYQPFRDPKQLAIFVDGKPVEVPRGGMVLGEHVLSTQPLADALLLRIDYAHGAVVTVTPWFWTSYGVWTMNVSVANLECDEGIMAPIARDSWLPRLANGDTVGPMPDDLHDRYVALYRTFADSWRVTNKTSLFVYEPGKSTLSYTDREWPAFEPPCKLRPELEIPGANPPRKGLTVAQAKKVCQRVTDDGLNQDCVFDVASTGDEEFARAYELAQELRYCATAVRVTTDKRRSRPGDEVVATAMVTNLRRDAEERPRGTVAFFVDEREAGREKLDENGRAKIVLRDLRLGERRIRATYSPDRECGRLSASSAVHVHTVGRAGRHALQPEDQLLPHVLKVPGPRGVKKHTEVDVDVKTARRILAFLNGANRAEDLLQPPEVRKHLHVEYRKRGFPERHAPVGDAHDRPKDEPRPIPGPHGPAHARHAKPDTETLRILAVEVLQKRNERPILGFTSIREILDLDRLRALIELWFSYFSRATKGEWSGPYTIPAGAFDRPVHAAVLRTGKVLFWGLPNGKNSWLWTPNGAGAGTTAPTANKPGDSLFCAGHSFLTDGRLLVAGGGGDGTGPRHNHAWIFDPATETWTRTANDMHFYRWYPTLVTMGDTPGRVLVVSGDDTSGTDVAQAEMYFEASDTFELVWGPTGAGDTTANRSFPQIYPAMNMLPGGEVFYTPTGWHSGGCSGASDYPPAKPSGFYDFSSTTPPVKATWTDIGTQDAAAEAAIDRVKGMAVLLLQPSYPFVQVLVVGGGKDPESATSFQMINLSTCTPKWGPPVTLPDGLARVNVNLVALPDGTVFVSGGRPSGGTPVTGGACWIYDPVPMTWQECDAVANRRAYHSIAVLLPDGRVATAGNECPADTTYEVFSPPYLFASDGSLAPRPQITNAPGQVHFGQTFTIDTPSPATVAKVTFVRPMAVTHQTDSEQRVVQLQFSISGATSLSATAPDGWYPHGLAPRGWYMLFLIDTDGVPSLARFVHLH